MSGSEALGTAQKEWKLLRGGSWFSDSLPPRRQPARRPPDLGSVSDYANYGLRPCCSSPQACFLTLEPFCPWPWGCWFGPGCSGCWMLAERCRRLVVASHYAIPQPR